MENLEVWVADELQRIIGTSDLLVVESFINITKKCKTKEEYIDKLQKHAFIDDTNALQMKSFACQLWCKLPHEAEQIKPARLQEERAGQEQQKNKSYVEVPYDDDDDYEPESKKTKTENRKTREMRTRQDNNEKESSSSNDEDESAKDIKNRDEFAKRILKRDLNNKLKKAAAKVKLEQEDLKSTIFDKRKESRRNYLAKRKVEKVSDLAEGIKDEKIIFGSEKLTTSERDIIKQKETLLKLVNEHDVLSEKGKLLRKNILGGSGHSQYVEDSSDKGNHIDQHNREERLINAATAKFGAKNAKDISGVKEYDLIMQDEIEFIHSFTTPGSEKEAPKIIDPEVKKRNTIMETRKSLPIYEVKEDLVNCIEKYQILIIEGETGSGKTTQLPQYLHEAGYTKNGRKIGCTQPRRVAAMSVAARVAVEMKVKLGNEVGYNIRFENNTQENTVIKFMTDGMLLKEFLLDPLLEGYSVMIIDEAHERSLHTDVLLGLVKDIARYRKDLKVLISSATIDSEKFSKFFDDAPVYKIKGRPHEVEVHYTKNVEADYVAATIATVLQIHATQPLGDILVFLTGQDDIEAVNEALNERLKEIGTALKELIILQIYANLPTDLQAKIFLPTPERARKVILATNIAETSLTIDGIVYVIDSGHCKLKNCDPKTGLESLTVTAISKAMARQRAGRAGRVSKGKCFRLYPKSAYENEMEDNTVPEIQRTNLANVILLLKSLGVGSQHFNDILHFDFMDPPPHESVMKALEHLYALGALNKKGELTTLGRKMAELPLHPMTSAMIIASEKYKCTEEILTIAAMLDSSSSLFYRPKDKKIYADSAHRNFICQPEPIGDHMMLLNVYQSWVETNYSQSWCYENYIQYRQMNRARDVREQLEKMLERIEITPLSSNDSIAIRKAITAGFFFNLAKYQKGGGYITVLCKQNAEIHPSSCLSHVETLNKEKREPAPKRKSPKWVIYNELVLTSNEYMRLVVEIEQDWVLEVATAFYKEKKLGNETTKKMPKNTGMSSKNNSWK